ncbi:MAG: hypothetical protein APF76_12650 [Desulfitibacter sp. BRH_c19]|nr:MAG: hypothetical protein APF76_12650 [Desulfitibacter sp. BRH_c19]
MNCEVCRKAISINYGDATSIICKDCIGSPDGEKKIREKNKSEHSDLLFNETKFLEKKIFIWLGKTIIILGLLLAVINVFIFLNDLTLFGSGDLLTVISNVAIGLLISTIGYAIPYLISIDENIKELNKKYQSKDR